MNIFLLNINLGAHWAWGGIESHSLLLAKILGRAGHRIVMGCYIDGMLPVEPGLQFEARRIRIRNSGDLSAILKLTSVMREEKIDIIIANHGREYWPAALAAKLAGCGVVLIRHQTDRVKFTTAMLMSSFVDGIIAVSDAVHGALAGSGVRTKSIDVIYNAVDEVRFHPQRPDREAVRASLGIPGKSFVIGTVGKLDRGKGVYDLLHAVQAVSRKYPEVILLFVGEGKERTGLETEAVRLSMNGRAIFAGVRRDVENLYAAMDVFTLPSTCVEGFGMVIIEAMAMQKPVIGTRIGGIPNIIEDAVTGLLVPPGNPEALAAAIIRLIDDRRLSSRLACEGRELVARKFSEDVMSRAFAPVLKRAGKH